MTESVYNKLLKLVVKYWHYFLVATLAALIYVLLNSLSIWLTASLINNILSDYDKLVQDLDTLRTSASLSLNEQLKLWTNQIIIRRNPMETLKILCIIIFVIFLFKNVFLYIKSILLTLIQFKMITELRNRLYEHLHSLSMSYFDQKRSGELTAIIITDVANMRKAFSDSFNKLFVEPINILVFITILFIISWKLALIALIIVPVAGFAIVTVGRSIRRKSRRTAVKIAGLVHIITETFASIRIVKAFAMKDYEISRFRQETQKYFHLILQRARLSHLSTPITESLGVIIGVILLWIGGLEVLTHKGITAEDFIRFILVLFSILTPAKSLMHVNVEIQTGMASAERVFNILGTEPVINDAPQAREVSAFRDKLEFRNICFRYEGGDERVLEDISFEIRRGDMLAVVGPSGAGKSTLADLIPRFYDPTSGEILLDGIDIRQITIRSLRQLMGIVTQETFLFDDTVRNNISYGDQGIPLEAVMEAARAANALNFIQKMPQGFDTLIGERGVKLSGGQKQRLAIARAILKNPPILILDEATSSLDTESELLVQRAIDNLMKDRTALVIAHRLSTVQNATRIIVLDKGRITETGTHRELIRKDGLYKYLYTIQFKASGEALSPA